MSCKKPVNEPIYQALVAVGIKLGMAGDEDAHLFDTAANGVREYESNIYDEYRAYMGFEHKPSWLHSKVEQFIYAFVRESKPAGRTELVLRLHRVIAYILILEVEDFEESLSEFSGKSKDAIQKAIDLIYDTYNEIAAIQKRKGGEEEVISALTTLRRKTNDIIESITNPNVSVADDEPQCVKAAAALAFFIDTIYDISSDDKIPVIKKNKAGRGAMPST